MNSWKREGEFTLYISFLKQFLEFPKISKRLMESKNQTGRGIQSGKILRLKEKEFQVSMDTEMEIY
jgi:hypothetical protein